jgi:hypothetical protein
MRRTVMLTLGGLPALLAAIAAGAARAGALPDGADTESAAGLRLVAHDALQARQTYQMVEVHQGNRWLLYLGHMRGSEVDPTTGALEANGTSVVDVTDPTRPRYLRHIPASPAPWFHGDADDATGGQHLQICAGDELPHGRPGRFYLLRNHGVIAQEILDVTDPMRPTLVAEVLRTQPPRDGRLRTHKNLWDCASGEAYLVDSVAGWTGQSLQIFDLSDPATPRHIRDFGLPGTQPGGHAADPGFSLHEANLLGDRVYLAYGTNHDGVIEILDRGKLIHGDPGLADPLAPTDASLSYPMISRLDMPYYWGGHTAKPIMHVPIPDYARDQQGARRNFLFVTSEGIDFRCTTVRHVAFFVDITDERHPWPVSSFQVPATPLRHGGPDFCERGVFGPHSPQASHNPRYEGRLLFLAYFTGGVRVIDMRNPFAPFEIGHFIARATRNSRVIYPANPPPDVKPWPVANTVEVDERGNYLFVADRPHNGLFILELTGKVRALAAASR